MKRTISSVLKAWKIEKDRKILLIRGARQVGKTYSIRELAREFDFFLEINFEKNPEVCTFFDLNLDPVRICENLSTYYGIPVIDGKTLLFFDEIQSCLKAIQSLRFFYESKPGLHVIAAGSLLEFAIKDLSSWGVGRIRSLFMYPMSFDEFLMANNQEELNHIKKKSSPENPLSHPFHEKLKDFLKKFMFIGGMPGAVRNYITYRTDVRKVQNVLSDITLSYYDDFAKYAKRIPAMRLRETLGSVVRQAGGKYVYAQTGTMINTAQAKDALDILEMAGLVYKVYHSPGHGLPLGDQANLKVFKVLLHDTGIFQQIAGLRLSDIIIADNIDMMNKGNIAETFAGIEMIKYGSSFEKSGLYCWHREKRGSSAEVDFLIAQKGEVLPVEIKSGSIGKMQSLRIFLDENKSSLGIRISMENFSQYGKIHVIPLYAVSNLFAEI